ncbi:hypothetical protein GCM10010207_51840 [Streptomyces atratus]|nr:hypothetical protein GCM10010207_51840 [Streptomyces atratus]
MDDAYVELAHRAVSGAFADERLVRAASMYPWDDSTVADLGVLTLPSFRGQGHARRVVRAICRHAAGQGHEPQYRCISTRRAARRRRTQSRPACFDRYRFPGASATTDPAPSMAPPAYGRGHRRFYRSGVPRGTALGAGA